jgi:ribonuclease BN (tRNA processing enzyme)
MKLHFLGTCAGTEPMPDRRHQSFAIEINGALYWFDAGACCSITGHLMGLDLLAVKKVIISHPHMDHVGGLGNLFWDIRKLKEVRQQEPKYGEIDLHIPEPETWNGFLRVLRNAEGSFSGININALPVADGVLFCDENMKVTAFHNRHLGVPADGVWKSFTYLIEAEGKRLVYSGDISSLNELDPAINSGCDAVLVETGHHSYMDVCVYLNGKNIKSLFYTHNGRSILKDPVKALLEAQDHFDGNVLICSDATSFSM